MGSPGKPEARLRPWGLVVVAAVVMIGAAVLPVSRWPGLIQFVALPPLDLVTDLRTLLVHASDISVFLVGLALSLVVRSVVLATLLGGLNRSLLLFAGRFYLIVLPFAFAAAAISYAAGAVLFYALFWFGFLGSVMLLVATGAIPWLAPPRLRPAFALSARRGLRAGTIGAYLAVLMAIGFVSDVTRPVGPILLVPASAAATFAAAQMLYADAGWKVLRRAFAVLPAAVIVALFVIVSLGPAAPPLVAPPSQPREGSIMLMSGIDSRSGSGAILEIDPNFMGWTCERAFYFSYAGPGNGQPRGIAKCPIRHGAPYGRADTMRSRTELVPFLEAQAAKMIAPGVVAGHSQGVWLVWEAAAERRLPNVATVVLVGPFPENPIAYPPTGAPARGHVGRLVLGITEVLPRPGGTSVFEPDSPLGREWLGDRDAIERTLARPLPAGIDALSVPSVFDLPLMPDGHEIRGAANVCPVPVIHPNLPYSAEFQNDIVRFLDGRPLPSCPFWREAIGPLFRPFSAPPSTL